MPEYEHIETELTCPKCGKGNVTLVISKKDSKEYKFFRCSKFDCDWNGGFYNQNTDKLDLIENCPSCDGILYLREGKNGPFLGCSHYPECKETKNISDDENNGIIFSNKRTEINLDDFSENLNDYEDEIQEKPKYERIKTELICPECEKGKVTLVISTKGDKESKFFRCSEFDCQWNGGFYNRDEIKLDNLEYCPRCDGILYERIGKNGPFMACSNFPDCKFTRNIEKDDESIDKNSNTEEENIQDTNAKEEISLQDNDEELNNEKEGSDYEKPKAEYERFETKLICPECEEGQVILIKNKDTEKGFFRCTNDECEWDGGPFSQPVKQLKHITYCREPDCKGINYHTQGKYGPYKACTWFTKTGCRPKKK